MKCLSIRQPWADLISDEKRMLEIRSWTTGYRGPLLIHTGLEVNRNECLRFGIQPSATGAIISRVILAAVLPLTDERWEKWRHLHLVAGPLPQGKTLWAWAVIQPQRFPKPIPYKGRLGLFEVPEEVLVKGGVRQ